MNEPSHKWKDGSVKNKVKINEKDKTSIFPLTKIFFLVYFMHLKTTR